MIDQAPPSTLPFLERIRLPLAPRERRGPRLSASVSVVKLLVLLGVVMAWRWRRLAEG